MNTVKHDYSYNHIDINSNKIIKVTKQIEYHIKQNVNNTHLVLYGIDTDLGKELIKHMKGDFDRSGIYTFCRTVKVGSVLDNIYKEFYAPLSSLLNFVDLKTITVSGWKSGFFPDTTEINEHLEKCKYRYGLVIFMWLDSTNNELAERMAKCCIENKIDFVGHELDESIKVDFLKNNLYFLGNISSHKFPLLENFVDSGIRILHNNNLVQTNKILYPDQKLPNELKVCILDKVFDLSVTDNIDRLYSITCSNIDCIVLLELWNRITYTVDKKTFPKFDPMLTFLSSFSVLPITSNMVYRNSHDQLTSMLMVLSGLTANTDLALEYRISI